jgi:hypothetical protein
MVSEPPRASTFWVKGVGTPWADTATLDLIPVAIRRRGFDSDTLTLAVRVTYLTSMAGSTVIEDDALREGPRATARPPPLVESSACRLRSPPKATNQYRVAPLDVKVTPGSRLRSQPWSDPPSRRRRTPGRRVPQATAVFGRPANLP